MRLVLVRDAEQPGLAEVRADELQSGRQLAIALADEAARDRHRREPGQVRADRVDVVQVHRDRVAGLGAELEGGGRRGRTDHDVHLGKGPGEIARDQLPHFLRLEVIRVVVPGGQHVGAGHDPALDLVAEALAARALVHVEQVARLLATMAEPHAVEPRKVGGTLRRSHDVIGRHGQGQVREAHLAHGGAPLLERGDRRPHELDPRAGRDPCRRTRGAPRSANPRAVRRARRGSPAPANRRRSSRADRTPPSPPGAARHPRPSARARRPGRGSRRRRSSRSATRDRRSASAR